MKPPAEQPLEIEASFIQGRLIAAYIHLSASRGGTAARSQPLPSGLVVDFGPDGQPVGIEVPSPESTSLATVNEALSSLGLRGMTAVEFSPLRAA